MYDMYMYSEKICERETGRGEGERESVKSKINLQLVS